MSRTPTNAVSIAYSALSTANKCVDSVHVLLMDGHKEHVYDPYLGPYLVLIFDVPVIMFDIGWESKLASNA